MSGVAAQLNISDDYFSRVETRRLPQCPQVQDCSDPSRTAAMRINANLDPAYSTCPPPSAHRLSARRQMSRICWSGRHIRSHATSQTSTDPVSPRPKHGGIDGYRCSNTNDNVSPRSLRALPGPNSAYRSLPQPTSPYQSEGASVNSWMAETKNLARPRRVPTCLRR